MPTCPHCRHSWTAPKPRKAPKPPAETGEMSDAQLYAHYKSTAPAEDIRFWIQNAQMSPGLRLWFQGLALALPSLTRADFYRQFRELQDRWRREDWFHRVGRHEARLQRRLHRARARQFQHATTGRLAA